MSRTASVRVELPAGLRLLARIDGEIGVEVAGEVTPAAVLDAVEAAYPMLRGTMRDARSQKRRAYIRFFACREDISHLPPETPLPGPVARGLEPFMVVGAIAGG